MACALAATCAFAQQGGMPQVIEQPLDARVAQIQRPRTEKTRFEAEVADTREAAAATDAASTPAPTTSEPPYASGSAAAAQAPGSDVRTNPPMFSYRGMMPSRPSWLFAIVMSLLTFGAGFMLGWRVLDRRIRARYGGLRIY
jgi:hypothetical protein